MSDFTDPIQNGEAIGRFLRDPVVQQVFHEQQMLYFNDWMAADDQAERDRLWGKARGLSDLKIALQAVVDAGEIAKQPAGTSE